MRPENLEPEIDFPPEVPEELTLGQSAADKVANTVGSWPFIISQSVLLVVWVLINVSHLFFHWDPYPFILMNLILSLQAAYTAPMIMMSQNRQAAKDRQLVHRDLTINLRAGYHIYIIHQMLEKHDAKLEEIASRLPREPPR